MDSSSFGWKIVIKSWKNVILWKINSPLWLVKLDFRPKSKPQKIHSKSLKQDFWWLWLEFLAILLKAYTTVCIQMENIISDSICLRKCRTMNTENKYNFCITHTLWFILNFAQRIVIFSQLEIWSKIGNWNDWKSNGSFWILDSNPTTEHYTHQQPIAFIIVSSNPVFPGNSSTVIGRFVNVLVWVPPPTNRPITMLEFPDST